MDLQVSNMRDDEIPVVREVRDAQSTSEFIGVLSNLAGWAGKLARIS
jgi:hypothetical protein